MAVDGIYFNGRFTRRPSIQTVLNTSNLTPLTVGTPNVVGLVGVAGGGQPGVPLTFVSPGDAINVLRSGDLLTACLRAFAPSDTSPGASQIVCVRANPASRATATLVNQSSAAVINLYGQNWGILDNQVNVTISNGTLVGKKAVVSFQGNTYTGDNLFNSAFSLAYTGGGSAATLTISATAVNSGPGLVTSCTGDSGSNLSVDFTVYTTVGAVVAYINSLGLPYTCVLLDPVPTHPSNNLDFVAGVNILTPLAVSTTTGNSVTPIVVTTTINHNLRTGQMVTIAGVGGNTNANGTWTITVLSANTFSIPATGNGSYTSGGTVATPGYQVTNELNAIINWFNGNTQPYLTATLVTGAGTIPANQVVYLSGGSEFSGNHLDGTTNSGHVMDDTADWGFAINQLAPLNVQWVSCVTPRQTVIAKLDTAVRIVSMSGYLPRRAIVGGEIGNNSSGNLNSSVNLGLEGTYSSDGISNQGSPVGTHDVVGGCIARAFLLNSPRTSLIASGLTDNDQITGLLTTYPAYIVAAQLCGLAAGIPNPGDAMTYLEVKASGGLEWIPTTGLGGDVENMLANGVMPMEFAANQNFTRVTRGITTWLQDTNFFNTEQSTGFCLDTVVKHVQTGLEVFIGQAGSPILVSRIASKLTSLLTIEENAGTIVGDAQDPAFSNITVSVKGDVVTASFQCSPAIPVNFVTLTITANTFTGSISVAVSN